jgi:hypothetical protein
MVPIEALRQISHLSPGHPRAMGALQGLGLGLLVGAATGAMIGLASGDDRCSNDWCIFRLTAAQKAVGGGIVLGGVGLILGTAIGAIVGAHTTIVFR